MRAAETDEANTDEIRSAQAETSPPDQPEKSQPEKAQPEKSQPDQPEKSDEPAELRPSSTARPPEGVEVITVEGVQEGAAEQENASVTQFDLEELQALGAQNISDLARVTPNLEIKILTASTPTFFIRGVGLNDFSSNAAGAVAIYSDGVPLNAPALQLGQLFDIRSVDVVRGPEGFGDNRNASAGAIRTLTNEPTGQYEASLRTDYGITYNMRDFEGAVAAPIVSNWLSARGAFRWTQRDPFYRNRCGNTHDPGSGPGVDQRVCNETFGGALVPRGAARRASTTGNGGPRAGCSGLQPPESDMDWLLNVHGGRLDEDA